MNMSLDTVAASSRSLLSGQLRALTLSALALGAGAMGCFRATGLSRPDVAVEEIPASGGDRILGLKATSGPGDFFLGNDSVQMAVDGAAFGDREGQFGAASGGAVLDVGTISLDQSFHRVSMPTDMLERLGPVANQDPDLPLVFDRYIPGTDVNSVHLDMQGYLLDSKGKLGATTGRVAGVSVLHRISLNKGELFFTLETTLTNGSGATLPVRSLGDYLSQHGGGFRFVVPARATFDGTPLSTWGVEIPGSDFTSTPTSPLTSSVAAPMVALMGSESAGNTFDYHSSLGLMPLDVNPGSVNSGPVDSVLVASDPQPALTENRPRVPGRLVVGSPAVAELPDGQSLSYRRRLYILGGPSYSSVQPAQATTLFSLMAQARAGFRSESIGYLAYSAFGTAARGGPLQTEFRIERLTPTGWQLERVEWREPMENSSTNGAIGMLLPVVVPDPKSPGVSFPYRLSARNADQTSPLIDQGTNLLDSSRSYLKTPIMLSTTQPWQMAEALSPERAEVTDSLGNIVKSKQTAHLFSARQAGTLEFGGLNPLRLTFQGLSGSDPSMQRIRQLSTTYSQILKSKFFVGTNFAAYHYTAANQVFGTTFGATASPGVMYFTPGEYLVHATRGPMSRLDSLPVKAFEGQSDVSHGFVVLPPTLPLGWTAFDLPAPTQATTGGFNPGELLSSALAEGVQVVVRTEEDVLTDPTALRNEFRFEIDTVAVSDAQRAPIGNDPFVVGARSSALGDGFTTALFTPAPTTDRNGGARPSKGWTLADFITQAEGTYTIVHQPRGATGLFTVRGFNRTVPLGSGVNAWWTQVGLVPPLGKHQGDFDALELIRAEGCDPADPTAWYTLYSNTRDDWFAILNQQTPTAFTKGLGLSAAKFSLDTPVGLARTYLNLGSSTTLTQDSLNPVLAALRSGAAVASTGPLLVASVGSVGPGGLVTGTNSSVDLIINLYAPDWVPVDEVRVVVNGRAPIQVPMTSFTASATDARLRTTTMTVPMPTGTGKDSWLVVEAGVSRAQTGAYQAKTLTTPASPWNKIMKGIYPIAITNPIFVKVDGPGLSYTPPGL